LQNALLATDAQISAFHQCICGARMLC